MSLLVIGVIYLEGKDGELVVKKLAAADSHMCLRDLKSGRNCHRLTLEQMKLVNIGAIRMMVMYHIQS